MDILIGKKFIDKYRQIQNYIGTTLRTTRTTTTASTTTLKNKIYKRYNIPKIGYTGNCQL